jgi:hypothetical protein
MKRSRQVVACAIVRGSAGFAVAALSLHAFAKPAPYPSKPNAWLTSSSCRRFPLRSEWPSTRRFHLKLIQEHGIKAD